jgi:hypothetical protein
MKYEKIDYLVNCAFNQHRANTYSQSGEDGVIAYLLGLAKIESGYFVEFGAWDGKHLSNSALLAEKGWSGCFIEGDKSRYEDLVTNYGENPNIAAVNAFVNSGGENSLDKLLYQVNAPKEITVLSIDIDGNDYHIWESLHEHLPVLCVIEFNPTIPADVIFVQDNDPSLNFGNSLAALWDLSLQKEYELVAATDWNAFFMPKALCEKYSIPTYQPNQVKNTQYETDFFQGYNGETVIEGCMHLVWHGIPFNPTNFQSLPKDLQKIPAGQNASYYDKLGKYKNTFKR